MRTIPASRIASHLARNLASLRHARGLTQDALAKSAGVPRSTIANLESGEGNPSLSVLVKVAGALGVPIDELLASPRAKVRKWTAAELAAQTQRSRRHERPLVPEPVPEEMLVVMDFAPGARDGRNAAPARHARILHLPRGRGDDLRGGRRHELAAGEVLAFPGNVAALVSEPDGRDAARGVSRW